VLVHPFCGCLLGVRVVGDWGSASHTEERRSGGGCEVRTECFEYAMADPGSLRTVGRDYRAGAAGAAAGGGVEEAPGASDQAAISPSRAG
jgi:hypothetical protein